MGRATRWLWSLLTGKKEGKDLKGKSGGCSNAAGGNDKRVQRRTVAFCQGESEKMQRNRATAVSAATAAATDAAVAATRAALAVARLASRGMVFSGAGEQWAAVRIQTAFRAYLARKALRALRALVKLQALVRGYLVRRQAAAALRSIQALIRAQEKARLRRLGRVIGAGSARWPANSVSRTVLDSPKIVEIDPGTPSRRFRRLMISLSDSGDEKPLDWCVARHERRRCSTAQNTPRLLKPISGSEISRELTGYMAKTRSFQAKTRSLSAPKQRPEPSPAKKRLSVSEEAAGPRFAGGDRKYRTADYSPEERLRGLSSPAKVGRERRGRYN